MTILFDRGLVQAKVEAVFDTAETPDPAVDSLLVAEPDFVPDITQLQRNNVRTTLSNDPTAVGRKIGRFTFQHEVRHNGNTDGTVEPRVGRVIEACGYSKTQINETAEMGKVIADADNTGQLGINVTTNYAGKVRREVLVRVVTGGGSGAAVVNISSPGVSDIPEIEMSDTNEITLQDGVEFNIQDIDGNILVGVTPVFESNNPATGDIYRLTLYPFGYKYLPESDNLSTKSLTLLMDFPDDSGQSLRHQLTGALGTFTVTGQGGQFALFAFTLTGSYYDAIDVTTVASPTYETTKPPQVEQAALYIESDLETVVTLCAAQFTIDAGVDVQPRECINEPNAFAGAIIVGRTPVCGFDPEAVLEATFPFWRRLGEGTLMRWFVKVGKQLGNTVSFFAPAMQFGDLGYANRTNIRVYQVQGTLALDENEPAGDNELEIMFQ